MAKTRQYQELLVWKLAHELCTEIYRTVRSFPTHERFALSAQLRRASYSVPMNLVEGNGRRTIKDKLRFVDYSLASLDELDYQLLLSFDLGYLDKEELQKFQSSLGRVGFLLSRFRTGVQKRIKEKESSLASPASLASSSIK